VDTDLGLAQIPTHSYHSPTGIYVTGDWATLNPAGSFSFRTRAEMPWEKMQASAPWL